jgi:hypothetical protein
MKLVVAKYLFIFLPSPNRKDVQLFRREKAYSSKKAMESKDQQL